MARDSDDSVVWVSASELLFGQQPLTLPVDDLKLTDTINLHATEVLETVPVIPLLYEVDVYRSILDRLRGIEDLPGSVIPLAYDWRKDLMDAVRSLDALILQLQAQGTKKISVVAHSLGGLILSYYLRYGNQDPNTAIETWEGAQRVSSAVMIGVPFQGVMNSFRNMNYGVTAKLNTSLLTAEAYSSFPSSYFTLPILKGDRLLTTDLNRLPHMIRVSSNWKAYGWGLLNHQKNLPPTVIEHRAEYMTHWLDRSRRFLELLNVPKSGSSPSSPPLLYMYGQGFRTLDHGVLIEKDTEDCLCLYFDNDKQAQVIPSIDPDRLYEDGDETVTVRSAALPDAFRGVFHTTMSAYHVSHTELVKNDEILEALTSFLRAPL
ncbi:MAG: hypothetical protein MRJ96_14715 [Nitrospirales bacterium]|nr:hypothetical protein [Nitrospira sp.]MDR4502694.1 hypothetical protein [Nitrospirales bacterium]